MDIYITSSGDTWDSIAYKALGDGMLMDLMIAENPQYVEVFAFEAGVELIVPELAYTISPTAPEWFD